jgi:glycosyltransferase involved in cell wall biosynthesis
MKILHAVLTEGFYGSERYCAELAAAQARGGHDVEVLIQDEWSACAHEMRKAVGSANPVGAGTMRLSSMPSWAPTFLHRMCAQRVIKRFKPDVVHTHLNPAARRVGREASKLGIPHVATLHIAYDAREHGDCDGLVCIADWQRGTLENFSGEVAVVHNWLPDTVADTIMNSAKDQVDSLRQSWQADHETFVFGSVGRLTVEKGMDRLVQAFRAAFPRGSEPARLVIVGDGPEREALEQLAAGDGRIFIAGAQEKIAIYYLAFDAFAGTARFEPFGLAILEAMAAGCPLVLVRSEGPSEFVTDKRVKWSEQDDEVTLAANLIATMAAGWHRFKYDLKHFSHERATVEIEALYRHVITRRRVAGSSALAAE